MKLYETIKAENWGKGTDGPPCLVQHFAAAYATKYPGDDQWVKSDEYKRLQEAIAALYPDRTPHTYPPFFNDHKDTTIHDVIRVCKFADV